MKRLAAMLLILALLLCSGCGLFNDPADNDLIVVYSNQESVTPYKNFLYAQYWSENGWMAADGIRLSWELSRVYQRFPAVTYSNDIEIRCRDKVSIQSVDIYNSDLQIIHANKSQNILKAISPGTYYLIITLKEQHNYISAGKDYEYTGYECAYKLIIP